MGCSCSRAFGSEFELEQTVTKKSITGNVCRGNEDDDSKKNNDNKVDNIIITTRNGVNNSNNMKCSASRKRRSMKCSSQKKNKIVYSAQKFSTSTNLNLKKQKKPKKLSKYIFKEESECASKSLDETTDTHSTVTNTSCSMCKFSNFSSINSRNNENTNGNTIINNNVTTKPEKEEEEVKIEGFDTVSVISKAIQSCIVKASKGGVTFAVKIQEIDEDEEKDKEIQCFSHSPREEAEIMRRIDHPNIIKFYDSFTDVNKEKLYIMMEYCSEGTLKRKPNFNIVRAFSQILSAVEYLHTNRIAHQDIKPSNVLIDDQQNAKLADFGTAVSVPRSKNTIPVTFSGTVSYFAPEIFNEAECDPFATDVWALGVTLYQLYFGILPFKGNTLAEKAKIVKEKELSFPEFADRDLVDLLKKMMCKDPKKRITIPEIWAHQYMTASLLNNRKTPPPSFFSLKAKKRVTL